MNESKALGGKRGLENAAAEAVWYFDVVSPFAYLALPAIEALAKRYPVQMRPVVLGALLSHYGQVGPAELAPKRLCTYRLVQFLAQRDGVALRFPPRHPFRSLDVQRLLAAAGGRPDIVCAAFNFIWSEGRDPSDPKELLVLRSRLRLPEPVTGSDQLRAWTDEAISYGVFGVPTLVIQGAMFWGADAMPLAEAVLQDPGVLQRGEMGRLAQLPMGVTRAPPSTYEPGAVPGVHAVHSCVAGRKIA